MCFQPSNLWGAGNPSSSTYFIQSSFSTIPHRNRSVYDLQKLCSSVAVICGKDDIIQKINALCLQRYLRTDKLILLLSSNEEVLQHLCAPCWFVPMLPEKGGSLDQKSHPESLVVLQYPGRDSVRGEDRGEGHNWVWGPHRDQMETQEQDVINEWRWWW